MPDDLERLNKIIPHWMEHNTEHAREFEQWAERARAAGAVKTAALIIEAATAMESANAKLRDAIDSLS